MAKFITQLQGDSSNSYNLRGTGFLKLTHAASGAAEDTYLLTKVPASGNPNFKVTSKKLGNAGFDTPGLCFILDTTMASGETNEIREWLSSGEEKTLAIENSGVKKLYGTYGTKPAHLNVNAKYLVVYDGSSFRVLNEAVLSPDGSSVNNNKDAIVPTVKYLENYVADQISNRWEYAICPATAASIPAGAIYKASSSATSITGTMAASASTEYKIYLVLHNIHSDTTDIYDEWVTIKNGSTYSWEKIGNTDVNLAFTLQTSGNSGHSHKLKGTGEHTHITSDNGGHTHQVKLNENSIAFTGIIHDVPHPLDGSDAGISVVTGYANETLTVSNNGAHTHSIGSAGAHTHSIGSAGAHSHLIAFSDGDIKLQVNTEGSSEWNDDNTLDIEDQTDIKVIKGEPTTADVTTENGGSHTHQTQTAGSHSHTTTDNGGHSHTTAAGDHSHTVSFGQSKINLVISTDGDTTFAHTASLATQTAVKGVTGSKNMTTSSSGAHVHTTETGGAHTHTTSENGNHSHIVSIHADDLPFSQYDTEKEEKLPLDGESNVFIITETSTDEVLTKASGAHTHSIGSAGAHTHTAISAGAHTHTTTSATFTVVNEVLNLVHMHTANSNGDHTHSIGSAGAHTHTAISDGAHSHSYIRQSFTPQKLHLRLFDDINLISNTAGAHTHTTSASGHTHSISSSGAHTHSLANVVTSENLVDLHIRNNKSDANSGAAGAHTHTTNTAGSHAHTTTTVDGHTHSISSSGAHYHTIKGVVTDINVVPLRIRTKGSEFATNTTGGHTHTAISDGAHTHTAISDGAHTHTFTHSQVSSSKFALKLAQTYNLDTATNGAHTHTIASSGAHGHTVETESAHVHTVQRT